MATITNAELKKAGPHRVLALYKFVTPKFSVECLPTLQAELYANCEKYHAKGTLLLAPEGINGTICYPFTGIASAEDQESNNDSYNHPNNNNNNDDDDKLLSFLQSKFGQDLRIRVSKANFKVFPRLKVKIKTEIVTLHCDNCDPTERKGIYVKPEEWNALLQDPDCLVVDTRNEYEVRVGTFRNAINPHTQNFVEFPEWMQHHLAGMEDRHGNGDKVPPKKVAMFCTGGIRCEKATNVCQTLVPSDVPVYHLEGGILAYLDSIPPEESLFDGDCYVFDQRVAVTYGNQPSAKFINSCKACRHPLCKEDMESHEYVEGLSCRWCYESLTDKQKERFASRQRQVEIARERGVEEFFDPQQMRKNRC